MTIKLNDEITEIPASVTTVAELVEYKGVSPTGTAIAVNNRLIGRSRWNTTELHNEDNVVLISAAFGG